MALGSSVYLWNAGSGAISHLCTTSTEDDYITSLAWAADGKHISVGTYSAQVHHLQHQRSNALQAAACQCHSMFALRMLARILLALKFSTDSGSQTQQRPLLNFCCALRVCRCRSGTRTA